MAFIAVALTDRLAGLASTSTISPVKGFLAFPAGRAGLSTRRSLTPISGTVNSPEPFFIRCLPAKDFTESKTACTSFLLKFVSSAIAVMIWDLVCFCV